LADRGVNGSHMGTFFAFSISALNLDHDVYIKESSSIKLSLVIEP
jgi:hypothetical protein